MNPADFALLRLATLLQEWADGETTWRKDAMLKQVDKIVSSVKTGSYKEIGENLKEWEIVK